MPTSGQIIEYQKEQLAALQREVEELTLENQKVHAALRARHDVDRDREARLQLIVADVEAGTFQGPIDDKVYSNAVNRMVAIVNGPKPEPETDWPGLLSHCARVGLWYLEKPEPENFCPEFMSEVDEGDMDETIEAMRVYFENAITDAEHA